MTSFVFDTGALSLLFVEDERLRPVVEGIQGGKALGILSSVTLSEYFYKTCQILGRDVAALRSRQLDERMRVVDADTELARAAGLEKCRNTRLSLADAFALSLARRVKGTLLTTDGELAKSRDVSVRHFAV